MNFEQIVSQLSDTEDKLIEDLKLKGKKGNKFSINNCLIASYLKDKLPQSELKDNQSFEIKVIWRHNLKGYCYATITEKGEKNPNKPLAPVASKIVWRSDNISLPDHVNQVAKDFDAGKYPEFQL